jgi:hypothetical protein
LLQNLADLKELRNATFLQPEVEKARRFEGNLKPAARRMMGE